MNLNDGQPIDDYSLPPNLLRECQEYAVRQRRETEEFHNWLREFGDTDEDVAAESDVDWGALELQLQSPAGVVDVFTCLLFIIYKLMVCFVVANVNCLLAVLLFGM